MKTKRILPALLILVLTFALAPSLATAQEQQDQPDQQSQPSTGAARVSLINGEVSTQRGDSGDWVSTTVNAPLVPGDRISTGAGSRAEVQLDYANVLRLDQNSEAKIADLTRSRIQVQLAQGNMDLSALKDGQADVEVDTPNVAVQPSGDGVYRIQVNGDQTQVIIRQGTAQISTPQGSTNVKAGDMITIEGTDNPQYQVTNAPGRDAWDDWNRDRDNVIQNAQSYSHTNRYYTGAQDLDRNGRWVYVPNYDYVWQPNVGADWAPYRDGR
ncbi:MAG TPA: FecR family protein, partial [Terriglobia bacterium]|nr:FecR family protein [Terriglobia bacterium]